MTTERTVVTPAFEVCELACSILLKESLMTHQKLKHLNLDNVVGLICSTLNKKLYSLMIVLTNKVIGAGRYAFIHNEIVDRCILDNDTNSLVREISLGKDMFREVYSNEMMTQDDIKYMDSFIEMECEIILNMIDNYNKNNCDETLYNKCREMVSMITGNVPSRSFSSDVVHITDHFDGSLAPCVFTVNRHDLLISLSKADENIENVETINPWTGTKYSDSLLRKLKGKYNKEIKIYKFAAQNMPYNL